MEVIIVSSIIIIPALFYLLSGLKKKKAEQQAVIEALLIDVAEFHKEVSELVDRYIDFRSTLKIKDK